MAFFVKQIVWPAIKLYREKIENKKSRSNLSNLIVQNCDFLNNLEYSLTRNSSKDFDNFIEYTNHKIKRKVRFHTKQNLKFEIEIVDSGFFPVNLNLLYNEMGIQNPLSNNYNLSIKQLINNFQKNFNKIESYISYKNKIYYYDKLEYIRKTGQYSCDFGYTELFFVHHLVKDYAESTIQKGDAKFAELGLILLATVKTLDIRDLLTSAILINCSLKEIGEDAVEYFEKYKKMNYNGNLELFDRMINDSNTLTEEDGCYTLEIKDTVEYKSKYYKRMNSYDEWYTHNKL